MKISTTNKRYKNNSSPKTISNSAEKKNIKKISPNKEKNNNDTNANEKTVSHSNSQLNIKPNKLTVKNKNNKNTISEKNTEIINSDIINIDNIDISAYNPDPFILPTKKFNHNFYISKIEATVLNYNLIKESVNKKILGNNIPKTAQLLQNKNFAMLEELDKLNLILDALVERKRFTNKKKQINNVIKEYNDLNNNKNINVNTNKNKTINNNDPKSQENVQKAKLSSKDINNQLLNNCKKHFDMISARYEKLTKDDYAENLKAKINTISGKISSLKDNIFKLKNGQIKDENKIKTKSKIEDLDFRKKIDKYEQLENEYKQILEKIPKIDKSVEFNQNKIKDLNNTKAQLVKEAKEKYNINEPEKIIINKKKANNEVAKNYMRKIELENNILIAVGNNKKSEVKKKDNGMNIKKLAEDKIFGDALLKQKKEELEKLKKKLNDLELQNPDIVNYIKLNSNANTNIYGNKITSNEKRKMITPIKTLEKNITENNNTNKTENIINKDQTNNKINTIENNLSSTNNNTGVSTKLNNRYSAQTINNNKDIVKNLNNNQTFNKKMVLEQLDLQKDQDMGIKMDKSINLKKNKYIKPNFSFSLNDKNSKDKKMSYSVALNSKTNQKIEDKNEIEGEIKEDIEFNNNEEKINSDNKFDNQKYITNLSQNISMDKNYIEEGKENENEEGKIRENDLNTVPYNEIDKDEKIENIDNDNEENNYKFTNSNDREHIFDDEQINIEDNQNENLNMD